MSTMPYIGRRIESHTVANSTNDLVRAAAERGEPEGLVVTAEEQLAGRGRMGRRWIVPRGTSLQISILLRPPLPPLAAARIVRMAALALARTLERHLQLQPALKWPNDILLDGRKCAGILIETSIRGDMLDYVILGIGLNVNYTMRVYPELASWATTLQDVVGREIDRAALERALLAELNAHYERLLYGDDLMDEYRARLGMLGQTIRVATATEILQGVARDVAEDGALVLERNEGVVKLYAGDVTILKPTAAGTETGRV
jgi:BirA family biotin operon repressor/biotin-[acetyl-CoA-carboxylase] ligase